MSSEEHASTFDMQISESSELKKREQVSRPHGHSSLFHRSSSLIPSQPSLRTLPDSLMTAAKNQSTQNLRVSHLFYHEKQFFAQIFICIQEDVTILSVNKKVCRKIKSKVTSFLIKVTCFGTQPVLKLIQNLNSPKLHCNVLSRSKSLNHSN